MAGDGGRPEEEEALELGVRNCHCSSVNGRLAVTFPQIFQLVAFVPFAPFFPPRMCMQSWHERYFEALGNVDNCPFIQEKSLRGWKKTSR